MTVIKMRKKPKQNPAKEKKKAKLAAAKEKKKAEAKPEADPKKEDKGRPCGRHSRVSRSS